MLVVCILIGLFLGDRCERDVIDCEALKCNPNGSDPIHPCTEAREGYTCNCKRSHTGRHCEVCFIYSCNCKRGLRFPEAVSMITTYRNFCEVKKALFLAHVGSFPIGTISNYRTLNICSYINEGNGVT